MGFETVCANCGSQFAVRYVDSGVRVTCPACSSQIYLAALTLQPGTAVGGFEIIEKVGSGGVGDVFLARQISMDRNVALKVLRPDVSRDTDAVTAFLSEIRAAARMEHPNMVIAYEAGEDEGCYFMAMTYVDGKPLNEVLAERGAMSEAQALSLIRKMADALAYAWQTHGMLHRDVKPGNILMDSRGEPKLADMGLALHGRLVAELATDEIAGTPNYMAPEQMAADPKLDFHCDMYALGATLYQVLTGTTPFEADTLEETLALMQSSQLEDPRESGHTLSLGCMDLLETMLARDAADRPATWGDVLADIDRVLDGKRPKAARPAGGSVLSRRPVGAGAGAKRRVTVVKPRTKTRPAVSRARAKQLRARAPQKSGPSTGLLVVLGVVAVFGIVLVVLAAKDADRRERERVATAQREAVVNTARVTVKQIGASVNVAAPASIERARAALATFAGKTPPRVLAAVEVQLRNVRAKLVSSRAQAQELTWKSLKQRGEARAAERDFEGAQRLLKRYIGVYAVELSAKRADLAREIEEQEQTLLAAEGEAAALAAAEAAAAKRALGELLVAELRVHLAAEVAKGDFEAVGRQTAELRIRQDVLDAGVAARELLQEVDDVLAVTAAAMNRYGPAGMRREIQLKSGVEKLTIISSVGGIVSARRANQPSSNVFSIRWRDLGAREKVRCLGDDESAAAMTARGIAAAEAGLAAKSQEYLDKAGTTLSKALKDSVDEMVGRAKGARASGSRPREVASWKVAGWKVGKLQVGKLQVGKLESWRVGSLMLDVIHA